MSETSSSAFLNENNSNNPLLNPANSSLSSPAGSAPISNSATAGATSVAGGAPGSNNKSPAFLNALERARQIAASKIKPDGSGPGVGLKRPIEDIGEGPDTKKLISATIPDPFFAKKMMDNNPAAGGDSAGGTSSETIMVPDKMVGLIIGRGGEQITRLQAETGCKIQMAQDSAGTNERSCTLTGNPQAIGNARAAIDRIISNEGSSIGGGGGNGHMPGGLRGGAPGGGPPGGMGSGFYEMNVPGQKVGLIIGKGGETIKQLQEQSGAKIVIIQEGPEAAHEKPLRITGTPENVERAKQLVSDILNQDHGELGGGPGGGYRGRGRGRGGRGGFMGRGGGGRGGGRGGYTPGGGGGQWGAPAPNGNSEYGGTHTDYITIPSNKCGLVIGKGGETIKNINSSTGAHCEVDKTAPPDAREKNFVIRGPPDAVERAKQMIMEKIGMGPNGNTYGNGSSYGAASGGWGAPGGASSGSQYQSGYQDPNMGAQPAAGPDYSSQWAEYYRTMGMTREAEAIEKHVTSSGSRPGAVSNGMPGAMPQAQAVQPAAAVSSNGAASNGGTDYSAQWAEYYRSIGKTKEAEAIENQMRSKGPAAAQPAGGQGYPATPQYAAGYYGGSQAPAAPAAAGYPGAPAAGYPGYAGYQPGQES